MSDHLTYFMDNVVQFSNSEPVSGLGWINDTALVALGNGKVLCITDEVVHEVEPHQDASILVTSSENNFFLTGADDGTVACITADLSYKIISKVENKNWIDSLLAHSDGSFAFSAGKKVIVQDKNGKKKEREFPSTVRGLCFAPKGYRLAVSHYNGVSLWYPNIDAEPEILSWKGSHLDITWSPDGNFIITSMQENCLHGWKLAPTKVDMQMPGYPSKIRSFSWTSDKKWLATSGAEAAILWPFESKDGPMGKKPLQCGGRPYKVSYVAAHPVSPVLAIGYEDGSVYLVRLTDNEERMVHSATPNYGAVTHMSWHKKGHKLVFGSSEGSIGVLKLPTE